MLTGLKQMLLELARDGVVLEEPDSRWSLRRTRELAHGEFVEAV